MRYATLVADPPWPLPHWDGRPGGRRHHATGVPYPTMTLDAIAALPVARLAAADAHLFLWATRRVFREGQAARVARAWGFEPCGEVIWGRRSPGFGRVIGADHEPVLIARRGRASLAPAVRMIGVHFWRARAETFGKAHSAKPDGFLDLVEQLCPGPYVELFARRQRLGWDTWGLDAANTAQFDPEAAG